MKKHGFRTSIKQYTPAILLGLALTVVLFIMMVMITTPEKYDISIGAPANSTIFATKDVEDSVTTQKLRDEAAAAVEYTYKSVDNAVTAEVLDAFATSSSNVLALRNDYTVEDIENMSDAELGRLNKKLGLDLSKADITAVLSAEDKQADEVFSAARNLLRDTLNSSLPEGQESAAVSRITRELTLDGYSSSLVQVATDILRAVTRPNMLIDEESTAANRQKAIDAVEPQICVKGEAVVREGDIVTEAKYQVLVSLGLVSESTIDLQLILGLLMIIICLVSSIALYIFACNRYILSDMRMLTVLSLIIFVTMLFAALAQKINTYLMPVSLGIMLIGSLNEKRLALFVNIILAITASLFASVAGSMLSVSTYAFIISSAVSGPVVIAIIAKRIQRSTLLIAGLAVSAISFITVFAVGLINSADYVSITKSAGWAACGGMFGAVIAIGMQPLLELLFNLVTNARLLELSNPNQPLLHRLLLEAPGTYHHSIIVANLADAAANAVGANALLARVGAYYHDVGKLRRPMYFKENQLGDNPHDRTDPRMSSVILTSHTKDGVGIAREARLPQEIIDIIQQHHGDSPVIYFYDKAKKLYGDDIDISLFRYEGPRPERREAAIVMLADIVEAATRSSATHEPEKIKALVRTLIKSKLTDGQLDKSKLNFSDLDKISEAFITVLVGVFHERISYPDVKLPPREKIAVKPEKATAEAGETKNG